MDSVSNGDVPEKCLAKMKEMSDVPISEKINLKSKTLNDEEKDLIPEPHSPSSKSPSNSTMLESCDEKPELADKKSVTSTEQLKSKDSESVADLSSNTKNPDEVLGSKENGIYDKEHVKSSSLNETPKSVTSNKGKDSDVQDQSSDANELKKSDELVVISEKSECSDNPSKDKKAEKKSPKTSSEDESLDASSKNKDIPELGNHNSLKKADNVAIGVEQASANVSKNHLMSGGSIVSSNDGENPCKMTKLGKEVTLSDSEYMDVDEELPKITSHTFSKSDTKSKNVSVTNNQSESCDQPLNFTSFKVEQSLKNKSETDPSSQSTGLIDLSASKGSSETNPLQKLNEHIKSLGTEKDQMPVHNHTKKSDLSSVNDTSALSVTTEKSHSHATSNKENKGLECTHSHERLPKESSDSFVFADLSNEETGFPEAFAGLVTIGKYISVKGDFTLRSTEALVESPSLVAPYLLKEPDTFPAKDKESKSEVKDFFHSAAGEILIGIGLSRVNEWFHRDMTRIKKRQMKRAGKTPELEEELALHEKFYSEAKKANSVYSFSYKACKTCGFTTESSVIMEGHLLVPHITSRREYECSFCDFINRDPKIMLEHMESEHKKIGRIQPPVLFFECPYCTFESNSKVKLNNHLPKCQRYFDHGINQAPPKDFEFPALTPKPITVAVVKAYEKSLGSMQRGRGRPKKDHSESMHMNQFSVASATLSPIAPNQLPSFRASSNSPLADSLSMQNQIIPPIQMPNMNIRPAHSNAVGQLRPGISALHMPPPNRFFQVVNPAGQIVPMMGNNHLVTSPSQFPFSSNLDNSAGKKTQSAQYFNSMFGNSGLRQQNSSKNLPSVTITPLPKLQGPYPVPMVKQSTASGSASLQSNSLVVCEICDGYIKDLEQLRTHMQLIHKVKIHPKMLVSRPPLNCQKCQWRFFTDQGLERHLLGAHGLVTSNMQELANKGKDAGCCTICGRVFASKLVSHMNQVHKVTLKPAHLSYKCTVCSATFNLYRLFENHVYLVHSGAAKRSADGRSSPSKKLKGSSDSHTEGDSSNHKDKRSSKDAEDENFKKCKECGKETKSPKEKCEKCLKSDDMVQGTLDSKTLKDELRNKDKSSTEKVA